MDVTQVQTPAASAAPTQEQTPAAKATEILKTLPPAEGAVPAAEAPKEEPKDEGAPKEDKFSSKFAALARRERKIQEREAKIKEMETRFSDYDKRDQAFKSDPLKHLQERYGLTYKDLTDLILNDNKPTPDMRVKEVESKLERMERERTEREEAQAKAKLEAEQKTYETTIQTFKSEISDYVTKNAETYELTAMNPEASEVIYNLIEQHFTNTDRVLSVEEAAKAVEEFYEAEAEKLLNTKKLKGRVEPKAEAGKPQAQTPAGARTLTNSHQTEVPTPETGTPRTLDESKAMAAKLLKWS